MFWAPNLFGLGPPNFWTCIIKRTQIAIMWQSFNFQGDRPREFGDLVAKQIKNVTGKMLRPLGTRLPNETD